MIRDPTSYREGVMAERRRTIRLALAYTNRSGESTDISHSLAHKISQAGEYLPPPHEPDPEVEEWSAFGERRYVREVPTFMESTQSIFTELGKQRIKNLENQVAARKPLTDSGDYIRQIDAQAGIITELRAQLGNAPKEIADLHELIGQLRRQLSGTIG